ncbi:hypothetical protein SNE40_022401 [Patella caerulea]|uniref:Exonuclease domain-containing protein n=1 Tax=Patella caerulea TaxID=87958 RepID=A0AAN8G5E4_PATCE
MDTGKKRGTKSDEPLQKQKKLKTKRKDSTEDVVSDSYEESIDLKDVYDCENEDVSDSENGDSIEKQKLEKKGARGGGSIERGEVAKKDRGVSGGDSIKMKVEKKDRGVSGGDSIKMKVEKKDKSGGGVDGPRLLFFDFETTGLIRKREPCPHIIQIGAVRGKKEFKIYVRPKRRISSEASKVNGITYEDGVMRSGGKKVECVGIKKALKQFYHFISANGNGSEIVGHYITNFDCQVLYHAVYRNKMIEEFSSVIKGCIDTHMVFRKVYPKLDGYSLDKLLNYFFGEPRSGLHDALSDAQLTKKVFRIVELAHQTRESLFSWKLVFCPCSLQPQSR